MSQGDTPPAPPPERGRALDAALVPLVLALALLAGAFKARNSDLFLHLAGGRLLAAGQYTFGVDPFSFASQGPWVNHSWLFDLAVYLLYAADPSGVALVAVKAALVGVIGYVMLRAGTPPGGRAWVPAACAALGVLALSPRMLMQPAVLSTLFTALTFLLLTRSDERPRLLWLLAPLFALWANLDAWFVLGPALLLLHLAGEAIQGVRGPRLNALALAAAAGVAACLLSPHHVHAFLSPPVGFLRPGGVQALSEEGVFRGYFLSPWFDAPVYFRDTFGLSVAGVAYFVLLAVSLASFAAVARLDRGGLRWSRLLAWAALALLSGLNVRAVPFFAAVAAPAAALNFLALARRPESGPAPWDAWAVPGRALTALALLGLCAASVPGATQAKPYNRREVGLGVEADAGLEGAARQIAAWRDAGRIERGRHWLTTSPEAAHYLAWFAPGEKGYVDTRLSLFADAGDEYAAVRKSLADGGPAWREAMERHGAPYLFFYAPDPSRATAPLLRLYADPDELAPCYVGGAAALFARQDRSLALDFPRRAFGPEAESAPREPGRAAPATWWQGLWPDPPTPADAWLAGQHGVRFLALTGRYDRDTARAWADRAGPAVGSLLAGAAGPGGPARATATLSLWPHVLPLMQREFTQGRDAGPADSLYLGARAARRALAAAPEDPVAHLALAEAYNRLAQLTRERGCTVGLTAEGRPFTYFPLPVLIRHAQAAAALKAVLRAGPHPERDQMAHLLLVETFRDPEFLEPQVGHMREFMALSRALGAMPGVPPEGFAEMLKRREAFLQEAEAQLKARRDQYESNASGKRGEGAAVQRAAVAASSGLPETAVKLLLAADVKDLAPKAAGGPNGAVLAIRLLLGLGRPEEAQQALAPDADRRAYGTLPGGLPAFEWLRAQRAAAAGDYAEADRALAEAAEEARRGRGQAGQAVASLVGSLLLREGRAAAAAPGDWDRLVLFGADRAGVRLPVGRALGTAGAALFAPLSLEASLGTLRAWLALEAGDTEAAREHARAALRLCDRAGRDPASGNPPACRPLAGLVAERTALR